MRAGLTRMLLAGVLGSGCLDPSPGGGSVGEAPEAEDPRIDAPLASAGRASFLTWNLKTFPLTSTAPTVVASLLQAWNDDVIAVQEIVDVETFGAMVDSMPEYAAVLNDDPGARLRVGLIYNTGRVTVDTVQTLFTDDAWAFPRPPLRADVAILLEGRLVDFTVIVVHLKSQVGEGTAPRREAAAIALHEWVVAHAGVDADRDIVILGDFNEEVVAPEGAGPFNVFLSRPEDYAFLTYDLNLGAGYSQLSYRSFLDHILVTTHALQEYGSGETAIVDPRWVQARYGEVVSDHLPVRAVFEPPPAAARR